MLEAPRQPLAASGIESCDYEPEYNPACKHCPVRCDLNDVDYYRRQNLERLATAEAARQGVSVESIMQSKPYQIIIGRLNTRADNMAEATWASSGTHRRWYGRAVCSLSEEKQAELREASAEPTFKFLAPEAAVVEGDGGGASDIE